MGFVCKCRYWLENSSWNGRISLEGDVILGKNNNSSTKNFDLLCYNFK